VRRAAIEAVARDHGGEPFRDRFEAIAERRGKNKANAAIARNVLTLVYDGLRDRGIRCLADQGAAWSWPKTTMPINLGEDMPRQPSLLEQPFSLCERPWWPHPLSERPLVRTIVCPPWWCSGMVPSRLVVRSAFPALIHAGGMWGLASRWETGDATRSGPWVGRGRDRYHPWSRD
jgi:hypothetical protein